MQIIEGNSVFSGGDRHFERVEKILPTGFKWIPIKGKMETVIAAYKKAARQEIVIFASGDPFFFGFGNTLKRLLPKAKISCYPSFNSLQRLAHKKHLNYSDLHPVSLHGRPWKKLDEALISGKTLIGILTDQEHSPKKIAERLMRYGYSDYEMLIGEELDGENEKLSHFTLDKAINYDVQRLNCLILKCVSEKRKPLSFSDNTYRTLEGRPNMMTKQAIRLVTINALNLHQSKCFWDIGACSGAVAIEAKRHYPWITIHAIEKREECLDIIRENQRLHHTPGIEITIGDFFDCDLSKFDQPQSVFIGGHGGRLKELIPKVDSHLTNGGVIVMNTVLESSYLDFMETIEALRYSIVKEEKISINEHNTIHVLSAQKPL
ncbi:MAG: precorrin-6y C5,15-methyltransferase (decarboxylating) subunit CbiE [Crocinitomicaceae bacterium]|nr:precorrin-6y C5,15-methyltransferase (decarboxylating) subunit CbiE [Crocinitomicaceae bacterium]